MWIEISLAVIILLLLGWIFFSERGGVPKQYKLSLELDELRKENKRLRDANEALRGTISVGARVRAMHLKGWFEFIRDLEGLRSAIAGSSICQKTIKKRYGISPGPELLERILEKHSNIDPGVKSKLANELLVGEIGRAILRSAESGTSLERVASNAGVPVVVGRREITKLQILGYLNGHLKPTKRGREALE